MPRSKLASNTSSKGGEQGAGAGAAAAELGASEIATARGRTYSAGQAWDEVRQTGDAGKREQKAAKTRADLLAATQRLVIARGYEAASVADIAKEAGYTKGALYAQFDSKEDLFLTMLREANAQQVAINEAIGAGDSVELLDALDISLLSMEAYLYGLRHPEIRPILAEIAMYSLESGAKQIHVQRGGSDDYAAFAQEDLDDTFALAAIDTLGGILAAILPPEVDVPGMVARVSARLLES